jgi:hypothetical protein
MWVKFAPFTEALRSIIRKSRPRERLARWRRFAEGQFA